MTKLERSGEVAVRDGQRYVEKLCKHWAHKLDTRLDDAGGTVVFPREADDPDYPQDAIATFRTTNERLQVHVVAFTPTQLEVLCGVIDDHLDRFAFREGGLRFTWGPA